MQKKVNCVYKSCCVRILTQIRGHHIERKESFHAIGHLDCQGQPAAILLQGKRERCRRQVLALRLQRVRIDGVANDIVLVRIFGEHVEQHLARVIVRRDSGRVRFCFEFRRVIVHIVHLDVNDESSSRVGRYWARRTSFVVGGDHAYRVLRELLAVNHLREAQDATFQAEQMAGGTVVF